MRAPLMGSMLWERVGALADEAPSLSDLRHHKLQLIAADRMRARGEALPLALAQEVRRAAVISLAVPAVLRRVRGACDGPMLVMKGAEIAARWPHPRLRPMADIDLLVEDADAVQSALLAAGFVELDAPELYEHMHHACPLGLPGLPLTVEIHRRPHWCGGSAPAIRDIVSAAQPSVLSIDGILAPRPDHHAVLLAAHAWAHDPLDRIGPLADVAAMIEETGAEAAARVAHDWGVARPWRATTLAIEELLLQAPASRRQTAWKRHLHGTRERTVLEGHVSRVVAAATGAPLKRAPIALAKALFTALQPVAGESWRTKLNRSRQAFRHAEWKRSQHNASLERTRRRPG